MSPETIVAALPFTHMHENVPMFPASESFRPESSGDVSSSAGEYTQRHREAWPLLLRSPDAETLRPGDAESWQRLWGRFGAELFHCFANGDEHIRADMILLARQSGGWRGEIIADRLEKWLRQQAV